MYKKFVTPIILFLTTAIIYSLASPGPTYYTYFTRLAEGFTHLHLYTQEAPSWLNELIPVDGRYYIALPPMPAVMMVPGILIFGKFFSETYFSIILAGINIVLVYKLIKKINFSEETAVLIAFFFGFGTNHWFLASVGSSWYIAHIVALFFLLLALLETFGRKRLWLVGLFLGAAFWSRTTVIFTLPFFFIYLYKEFWAVKKNMLKILYFILPVLAFIFLDALYNYLRFNKFSPLAPYQLIPGISSDRIFGEGFMSLKFIPRHLKAIFFELPKIQSAFPYMVPSLYASALWFTSPLLLFITLIRRNILTLACWSAIIPTVFVISLWAGVGYAQFGYRFAQDFMPFLLILTAIGIGNKPSKIAYLLLTLSILVNAWGVIVVNKLNIFFM
ncbi:hypothetical protein HYW46_04795 [Candidatus Daviesbacteria bacterium]|nr:hypothetical protein [Candidatus Daviesbacteria bacterium]